MITEDLMTFGTVTFGLGMAFIVLHPILHWLFAA